MLHTPRPTPTQAWPTLPRDTPPHLVANLEALISETVAQHGVDAFLMPRAAALAHETGHAIVGAHEGLKIRRVSIFSRDVPGFKDPMWGGWCTANIGWTSDASTPPASDLSRARVIVAGLAAEAIVGLDKPGSSLDELLLSQVLGTNAAHKLDHGSRSEEEFYDYTRALWDEEVWRGALEILRRNRPAFEHLIRRLDAHGKVSGVALHEILKKVTTP